VEVVDASGDEPEERGEREEEHGPADRSRGGDAEGALLVEAVFCLFWFWLFWFSWVLVGEN
jgi:hypothetical protein